MDKRTPTPRRTRWVFLGFLAVAGFFLWTEHRAHLMGALPYLLLLACPLMHLLHGHGHHGGQHGSMHRHTDSHDVSETNTRPGRDASGPGSPGRG